MNLRMMFALAACILTTPACVGSSSGGGGVAASSSGGTSSGGTTSGGTTSGGTSSGGTSSGGTSSGGSSGDSTKNTASIKATDDKGTAEDVKVDKSASKDDANKNSGSKNGAQNAEKELIMWLTSGDQSSSKIIEVHINTDKVQLPAKGIKVGEAFADAWVTYQVANATGGGVYESKDAGTIDIDTCPTKEGEAIVGKFNGVVVHGKSVVGGPDKYTLDGTFNVVYFGGAGALNCKPPETSSSGGTSSGGTSSGGTSSGGTSSGGGTAKLGSFKKPASATCEASICDGGANTSRNCCPHLPCLDKGYVKCADDAQKCIEGCGQDFGCFGTCAAAANSCIEKVPDICETGAACKTAMNNLMKCGQQHSDACEEISAGNEEKEDACVFDKCCTEIKAAL